MSFLASKSNFDSKILHMLMIDMVWFIFILHHEIIKIKKKNMPYKQKWRKFTYNLALDKATSEHWIQKKP